jgi:hypothetical protein
MREYVVVMPPRVCVGCHVDQTRAKRGVFLLGQVVVSSLCVFANCVVIKNVTSDMISKRTFKRTNLMDVDSLYYIFVNNVKAIQWLKMATALDAYIRGKLTYPWALSILIHTTPTCFPNHGRILLFLCCTHILHQLSLL